MTLNGFIAHATARRGRVRRAPVLLALVAGFTMASGQTALAHHFTPNPSVHGTTCDSGFRDFASGPPPLAAAPGSGIRIVFAPNAFRDIGGKPYTEVGNSVNVYAQGTPAAGFQISDFCRWFDDQDKPSTQHFDGGGPFAPNATTGVAEHAVPHIYSQPGEYELWTYAIDTQSPRAWSTKARRVIYVNGRPTASFGSSPAKPVAGQEVTFTSTSADHPAENQPLKSYAWDLDGDGQYNQTGDRTFGPANQPTAKYSFTTDGPHTVRLQIRDDKDAGPLAPATQVIRVGNSQPSASLSFSPTSPRPQQAVSFSSTSTDPDGDRITKWEWDFDGDGLYNEGSTAVASHAFPRIGPFAVSLRVTDERGATATARATVSVSEPALTSSGTVATAGAGATERLLAARIRLRVSLTRVGAQLNTIGVTTARGAMVRVRCAGGGCKAKRQTLRSSGKLLRLKRFQRSYRAGTVLQVYITQQGSIGRYVRIKIRKGKAPLRTDLCLKPGARRPTRCR